VRFPSLTINHGMIIFGFRVTHPSVKFLAYDPNDPARPGELVFDCANNTFSLPSNHYWIGGRLNIIEIFRGWLM